MEICARNCILSQSCDMFEWAPPSCRLFRHENRKLLNLYDLVEEDPTGVASIYVMHCSQTMENLVSNSDLSFHTTERKKNTFAERLIDKYFLPLIFAAWVFHELSCDMALTHKPDGMDNNQGKHSVHGKHRFMMKLTCDQDEKIVAEQLITEIPKHMTPEYMDLVNPTSYFRYWLRSFPGDPTVEHVFRASVELLSGANIVGSAGLPFGTWNLSMGSNTNPDEVEHIWFLPELKDLNVDSVK